MGEIAFLPAAAVLDYSFVERTDAALHAALGLQENNSLAVTKQDRNERHAVIIRQYHSARYATRTIHWTKGRDDATPFWVGIKRYAQPLSGADIEGR